ncbi:MAG TPA: hypothetical protein VMT23_02675 [Candidatus Binatia bacterium]|nr:hypothetical protein [Candidatus Binatia bacterium]
MKNWLKKNNWAIVFSTLLVVLASAGVAHADTTNTVLSTLITPQSPEATTSIDQRLASRETAYKSQLAGVDKTVIATKCKLAQSALIDVRSKDQKAAAIRLQAYNDLTQKLGFLVDNLSNQSVDATQLLTAQNQFVATINTYLNDAENYKAAMDDAITIDCVSDPTGFEASVLDARKLRAGLKPDVTAIKANETPLLKALSYERQLLISSPAKAKKTN